MKRHILPIILSLFLLPLHLFAQAPEKLELLPQMSHVVVLGDSNTWLGGDECDNEKGWTFHFK